MAVDAKKWIEGNLPTPFIFLRDDVALIEDRVRTGVEAIDSSVDLMAHLIEL